MINRLAIGLAGVMVALAAPALSQSKQAFSFVALGDTPYFIPEDYAKFDRLIDAINREKPAFSVHIGDIKSANAPCSDDIYGKVLDQFARFEGPLIYTPGDNEWTDCHREKAGGHDPIERLARVRQLFFAKPTQSLGKAPLAVESQSKAMPEAYARYVENQRFEKNGVLFATAHIVGSNNNLEARDAKTAIEFFERDGANVAWIRSTFEKASASGAKAVVLAWQADLWDIRQRDPYVPRASGFVNTIRAVERGAKAFGKPVLVIYGDEHIFRVGPFLDTSYKPVPNVTTLEVMGEHDVHGVKVTVDPETPGVFSFTPLIVPENLGKPDKRQGD